MGIAARIVAPPADPSAAMIAAIKEFFAEFIEAGARQSDAGQAQALQVATAALLLEMMHADEGVDDAERAAIADSLRRQFGLDAQQFATLLALAQQQAAQATDYFQFTSLINKTCDAAQKVVIIENLWRVALADGRLDDHELHLMRKLADLLYVGHADYIAAKERARAAAGVPPVV
jgi:uncharacterized tellurite resistance protein B-like protein